MFISDLLTDQINLHRLKAHSVVVMSQFYRREEGGRGAEASFASLTWEVLWGRRFQGRCEDLPACALAWHGLTAGNSIQGPLSSVCLHFMTN